MTNQSDPPLALFKFRGSPAPVFSTDKIYQGLWSYDPLTWLITQGGPAFHVLPYRNLIWRFINQYNCLVPLLPQQAEERVSQTSSRFPWQSWGKCMPGERCMSPALDVLTQSAWYCAKNIKTFRQCLSLLYILRLWTSIILHRGRQQPVGVEFTHFPEVCVGSQASTVPRQAC